MIYDNIRETGLIIRCKARARSRGQTIESTLEITMMIRKMALVYLLGTMADNIQVNGRMENSMVKVNTKMLKASHVLVSGSMENVLTKRGNNSDNFYGYLYD